MSERIVEAGDIVARELGALRRLTLNRPQAFNALTLDMAATTTRLLRSWAGDASVTAVLIDGAGERGLCAGGDLRALYDAARAGDLTLPANFWATEYRLDVLIARFPKPVIAVMDGLVMGGGVGVSAHAAQRVVTERSLVAMPEVGIGYFPDVGACFLLARAPGQTGAYLALTGERVGAADAIYCGLADTYVAAEKLAGLPSALAECRSARDVRTCLRQMSAQPAAGRLAQARSWIDACFGADRVEDIVTRLCASEFDAAHAALSTMQKMSPTSLKITLRNIRSALSFGTLEQSFAQDYRISLASIAGHDFVEGMRAAVIDKDRKPVWRPDQLAQVTPDIVERHFRSLGAAELTFPE